MSIRLTAFLALAWLTGSTVARAQLVVQQVPFQSAGSSYYDGTGLTWGINGPGFFANFNGNGAVPPFGNFDPNAGARTGIGFRNGPWSGHLGLSLNQGSSRSNQSTTASLITIDGFPGSISNQTVRPFVTGVVPIVGGAPAGFIQDLPPVTSTGQESLAGVARQQLTDVQRRQQANHDTRQKAAYQSFRRGLKAEQEGKLRMARANYQNALRVAEGELRIEVLKRIQVNHW